MLPEGTTAGTKTEPLGHGVNDFGNARYDGPQPPPGHGPHHYHFLLLALNTPQLRVSGTPSVTEVWEAARRVAIGEARLTGIFER
ncbi:MAG TPA: YbhB/YbcL family Raf kinase inhibitor-like protein, partial [Arenibaculum sp.]|nr:YbhB/YbcL family Raf kinase inhibitor-like protein [Arenibaculum sp.]